MGLLPNTMTHLYLPNNEFSGNLDTDISGMSSASGLLVLSFSENNNFDGTVSWTDFPGNLTELYLYSCNFTGTVGFNSLPNTLEVLMIHDNSFSGSPDMTNIPTSLRKIIGDNNEFSGSLDLDVPFDSNLEHLWLFSNNLYTSNTISFASLPDTIISILLGDNILGGTVDFENAPTNFEYLFLDYNNISKGVDFLNTIPDNTKIRLDIGVFCTQEFCDVATSECSIPAFRKRVTCKDYVDCLSTCQCAACSTNSLV